MHHTALDDGRHPLLLPNLGCARMSHYIACEWTMGRWPQLSFDMSDNAHVDAPPPGGAAPVAPTVAAVAAAAGQQAAAGHQAAAAHQAPPLAAGVTQAMVNAVVQLVQAAVQASAACLSPMQLSYRARLAIARSRTSAVASTASTPMMTAAPCPGARWSAITAPPFSSCNTSWTTITYPQPTARSLNAHADFFFKHILTGPRGNPS